MKVHACCECLVVTKVPSFDGIIRLSDALDGLGSSGTESVGDRTGALAHAGL